MYTNIYTCSYMCICIYEYKCLFTDDSSLSLSTSKCKKLMDPSGVYINTYIHCTCIYVTGFAKCA